MKNLIPLILTSAIAAIGLIDCEKPAEPEEVPRTSKATVDSMVHFVQLDLGASVEVAADAAGGAVETVAEVVGDTFSQGTPTPAAPEGAPLNEGQPLIPEPAPAYSSAATAGADCPTCPQAAPAYSAAPVQFQSAPVQYQAEPPATYSAGQTYAGPQRQGGFTEQVTYQTKMQAVKVPVKVRVPQMVEDVYQTQHATKYKTVSETVMRNEQRTRQVPVQRVITEMKTETYSVSVPHTVQKKVPYQVSRTVKIGTRPVATPSYSAPAPCPPPAYSVPAPQPVCVPTPPAAYSAAPAPAVCDCPPKPVFSSAPPVQYQAAAVIPVSYQAAPVCAPTYQGPVLDAVKSRGGKLFAKLRARLRALRCRGCCDPV